MTEEIVLRRLLEDDREEFRSLSAERYVSYMTGGTLPCDEIFDFSLEKAHAYSVREGDVFCGYVSLFKSSLCDWPSSVSSYEMAFALNASSRGRGIGTKMMEQAICIAKEELSADALVAGAFSDNEACRRLLGRYGFRYLFTRPYEDGSGKRKELIHLLVLNS